MQKFFNKRPGTFSHYRVFFGAFSIMVFFCAYVTPAFASYAPGETLNPSCAPGDAGCSVITPSSSLSGDVVPSSANTYSLGSAANPWKDLYVSSNSIYIAGISLSVSSSSALQWGGAGGIVSSNASATSNIAGDLVVGGSASLGGLVIDSGTPTSTANALYNVGGKLYWNGQSIATSTAAETDPIWNAASSSYLTQANASNTYLTISTGLTVSNFATNTISQWTNNAGYTTTTIGSVLGSLSASGLLTYNSSTGVFGYSSSSLALGSASHYALGDFLASTTAYVATTSGNWAGTWQGVNSSTFYLANNPNGYISTSTGLTVANFATSSISQWNNDAGYLTQNNASNTYLTIASAGSNYINTSSLSNQLANYYTTSTANARYVATSTLANYLLISSSTGSNLVFSGGVLSVTTTPSFSALTVTGPVSLGTTTVNAVALNGGGVIFSDGSQQATAAVASGTTSSIQFNNGSGFGGDAQYIIDNSDGNASKLKVVSPNGNYLTQLATDQLWNTGQVYTTANTLELWAGGNKQVSLSNTQAAFTQPISANGGLAVSGAFTLGTSTGILKASSGTVGVAASGIDYEVPLTFSGDLQRVGNTIGFATTSISQFTNNVGYLTTSTGLAVVNFATSSISQWNNDVGYLTQNNASNTYFTIASAGNNYVSTSSLASQLVNYVVTSTLANYYTTSTTNTRFVVTSTLANYLLISSSTGANLVWSGSALGVTTTPSFSTLTLSSFTPSTTANALYNTGGSLYWNGTPLALSSSSNSLVTLAVSGTSTLANLVFSSASSSITNSATGTAGINFSKGTLYLDTANSRVGIGTVTPVAGFQASSSLVILGTGEGGTPGSLTIRGVAASGTNLVGADITFDASNGTGSGGSGNFIFRTAGSVAASSPSIATTTIASANSVNTYTFSHTVPAGTNRLLLVQVVFSGSSVTVSNMTYGGTSMVGPGTSACGATNGNGVRSELWYLINPSTGANNIVVNASGYAAFDMTAISVVGANQSSAVTCGTAGTGGTAASAAVASASGDLVIDLLGVSGTGTLTPASAQTVFASQSNSSLSYSSSYVIATSTNTTMSWTLSWLNWAQVVADIKSASAGGANNTLAERMRITPSGNVGIGTATPAVPLQVFGDIRMGNAATNGCIQNFAGTGLAGACASDERLKTNITPIENIISKVSELQPVTFSWNDLAAQTFGNHTDTLNYGLVAQQVAPIFPDMVTTTASGYLSVDYSMLPMLTLQGLREVSMLASSTAPTSTVSASGTIEKTFVGSVFDHLASWFANVANGIKDFYASIVHANKLCLKKSDGTEACVNGDELAALIANRNSGGGAASNGGSSSAAVSSAPANITTGSALGIAFAAPAAQVTVSGTAELDVNITLAASTTLSRVDYELDDVLLGQGLWTNNPEYSYLLNTQTLPNGTAIVPGVHTVTAIVTDSTGATSSAELAIITTDGSSSVSVATTSATTTASSTADTSSGG